MQTDNACLHLEEFLHLLIRPIELHGVHEPVAGNHAHDGYHTIFHGLRRRYIEPLVRHILYSHALDDLLVDLHLDPEGTQRLRIFPKRQGIIPIIIHHAQTHGNPVYKGKGHANHREHQKQHRYCGDPPARKIKSCKKCGGK